MRRVAVGVLAVLSFTAGQASSAAAQTPAQRPNIVYILSDDQGWKDVGFHGSAIKTPTLDRLAAGGARLEQFYTQYADIRRFIQLTVTLSQSGTQWAWPERRLTRILF